MIRLNQKISFLSTDSVVLVKQKMFLFEMIALVKV